MNKLLSLFMSASIFSACSEKVYTSTHNDLFFDNLKGQVEKVEEISFRIDSTGKTGAQDSCCINSFTYDKQGYRIKQVYIDIKGLEKNGQLYTQRFSNGMVKEIKFTENAKVLSTLSGTINNKGKYGNSQIHDSLGKLVSFFADVNVNEYGKIISMKSFKPDSTLQQTIVNKYDKQIWVGGFVKDSSGKEIFSTAVKLNEKKDPTEVRQTFRTNSKPITTITRYAYSLNDEHGNWIQCSEFDEKGKESKRVKRRIIYREK